MKHLIFVPMLFMASCSSLEIVGSAVEKYCSLSEAQRIANREAVSEAVAPNQIEITCEQIDNSESI